MINGFIATLFNGITASMGNVVAVENDEKKLEIFDAVFFLRILNLQHRSYMLYESLQSIYWRYLDREKLYF